MPRTSDGSGRDEQLLRRVEVRETDAQGTEFLVPTHEMMEGLMDKYLAAASFARDAATLEFYAQSVALLRRFDRRLSALENRAHIGG